MIAITEITDVKKRIIQESLKLFMKYGVKSITMNEIAQSCGISKRTLYENFEDKDELLSICVKTMNAHTRNENQLLEDKSKNVLDFFMQSVQQFGEKTSQVNPNFFRELNKFHPNIAKEQLEHVENTVIPDMTELIQKGIAEGVFRTDINIELIIRLLLSQFDSIINSDFIEKVKVPVTEIFQTVVLHFVRSIATSKGLKNIEAFGKIK